jgi:hypothetical protein
VSYKDFCVERIKLNLQERGKNADYQSCNECYNVFVEYCNECFGPIKVGLVTLNLVACLYTDECLLSQIIDEYFEL